MYHIRNRPLVIILDINMVIRTMCNPAPNDQEIMICAANWIFTVDAVSNKIDTNC